MKKVVWCGVVLMACLAVPASAMAASGEQQPRRAQKKLDKAAFNVVYGQQAMRNCIHGPLGVSTGEF